MQRLAVWFLLSLTFAFGGCITDGIHKEHNGPIVSPTNITNEKQDETDPVLPAYVPWWVEE